MRRSREAQRAAERQKVTERILRSLGKPDIPPFPHREWDDNRERWVTVDPVKYRRRHRAATEG